MNETFPQYLARIDGYLGKRVPLAVMRATPERLARKLAGASRAVLRRRPDPKKWSGVQILAHLADIEVLWGYRIRAILGENGATLIGMDQDRWVVSGRYDRADPGRSLAAFRAARTANLDLIRRVGPSALSRWGAHSQFGRLRISRILRMLAGHDLNHERQIDAILAGRPRSATARRPRKTARPRKRPSRSQR